MMTPSRCTERRMMTGEGPFIPHPPVTIDTVSSFLRVCCGSLEGHNSTVWSISFDLSGNRLSEW